MPDTVVVENDIIVARGQDVALWVCDVLRECFVVIVATVVRRPANGDNVDRFARQPPPRRDGAPSSRSQVVACSSSSCSCRRGPRRYLPGAPWRGGDVRFFFCFSRSVVPITYALDHDRINLAELGQHYFRPIRTFARASLCIGDADVSGRGARRADQTRPTDVCWQRQRARRGWGPQCHCRNTNADGWRRTGPCPAQRRPPLPRWATPGHRSLITVPAGTKRTRRQHKRVLRVTVPCLCRV